MTQPENTSLNPEASTDAATATEEDKGNQKENEKKESKPNPPKVSVYMTLEQKSELEARARAAKKKVSSFVLEQLFEGSNENISSYELSKLWLETHGIVRQLIAKWSTEISPI